MKKLASVVLFFTTVLVFQFCSSSKKTQTSVPKTTYSGNVQQTIAGNCSPCHVGANARSGHLDSYDAAKSHINEILRRIQLNPSNKDFMPFKHAKLPDSTIQIFVKWKENGLLQ